MRESNSTHSECEIIVVSDDTSPAPAVPMETQWVKHGDVALTRRHLQDIVNGKELSDLHIDAFQNTVKIQFSHIAGLLNPIYQEINSFTVQHRANGSTSIAC